MAADVIRVHDLSKKFVIRKDNSLKERIANSRRSRAHREEFWALRDINVDVQAGHTLGLIGTNGSGKSTLLKIIGGIIAPTSGSVERRGRLAALLELGAGFHPDLTGRENVYLNASILGLSRKQTDYYFDAIVDFAGIADFIDTQVKFYSSGMYLRLAFAVAVHVDPEILLVDEILAVGDEPFQRKCLDRIKQFQHEGRTIVLVTHSLEQVRQMCDRVVLLDKGNLVMDGPPSDAVRHFRESAAEADSTIQEATQHAVRVGGVRLLNADGATVTSIDSGTPVSIELTVRADQTVKDWSAGIAISDAAGSVVFGTNTFLQGRDMEPLKGERTVRFGFDSLPLSEGQYVIAVAVHPTNGPDYHRIDRAGTFLVRSDSRDAGVLALDVNVGIA